MNAAIFGGQRVGVDTLFRKTPTRGHRRGQVLQSNISYYAPICEALVVTQREALFKSKT